MAKSSAQIEPSPDFTYKPGVTPISGDCRPWRKNTYRLEAMSPGGGKTIVHNYGHGGAGISMSWGCAQEVVKLVKMREPHPSGKPVAVLGAGVMGLTAATLLEQTLGMRVMIYAKAFPPCTTSNIAGGQWGAAKVEYLPGEKGKNRIQRILTNSYNEFVKRGAAYGVSPRTNYSTRELPHFELVKNVVCKRKLKLPFQNLNGPGFAYETLLVEPPIFLAKLVEDLRARPNVQFVEREFHSETEVMALPEKIVVNCTGLGSRTIWPDSKLMPVRGQLVLLPAQPNLKYLFSGPGYLFPRADCTVLGGTWETDAPDCKPDEPSCAKMVSILEALFAGAEGARIFVPSWMVQDE